MFEIKGHNEEDDEEDEGALDPSIKLCATAELLMIGSNEKAKLFDGFLARHFFRGIASVSFNKNLLFFVRQSQSPNELIFLSEY